MAKFRPLPEPIRLQDLLNSARSRTEKKIIRYTRDLEKGSSEDIRDFPFRNDFTLLAHMILSRREKLSSYDYK